MDAEGSSGRGPGEKRVWPLLHLKADWSGPTQTFGHGLSLAKLTDEAKETLGNTAGSFYSLGFLCGDAYSNLDWVAVIDIPEATQPVPLDHGSTAIEGGGRLYNIPDFEGKVGSAIMTQFLRALRLVKDTNCVAPDRLDATFDEDGAVIGVSDSGVDVGLSHDPKGPCGEAFSEDDLSLLAGLWDTVYRLFALERLCRKAFDEKWFARIDSDATRWRNNFVQRLIEMMGSPEAACSLIDSTPQNFGTGESPAEQAIWARRVSDIFFKEVSNLTSNETRLGRAVAIFDEGLTLSSDLHSFLSMFLVLETLFNTERDATTHKLAQRATRILWDFVPDNYLDGRLPGELTSKRQSFRVLKNLYRDRSNVIHGSLPFSKVSRETREMAVYLARRCLQTVLLNEKLFELFSHRQTAGPEPHQLRDFFRGLELGEDV